MFTDAAMHQAERAHCLRLVAAGAGWDAYVLAKARALDGKRAYSGLAGAVERAITEAGRKLPQPWIEPTGTEVFNIPPGYRMATNVPKEPRNGR